MLAVKKVYSCWCMSLTKKKHNCQPARKSQRIIRVSRIHPLGTTNVWNVMTTPAAMPRAWLKMRGLFFLLHFFINILLWLSEQANKWSANILNHSCSGRGTTCWVRRYVPAAAAAVILNGLMLWVVWFELLIFCTLLSIRKQIRNNSLSTVSRLWFQICCRERLVHCWQINHFVCVRYMCVVPEIEIGLCMSECFLLYLISSKLVISIASGVCSLIYGFPTTG